MVNKNGEYTEAEWPEFEPDPCPDGHGPCKVEWVHTQKRNEAGERLFVPGMQNCPVCGKPPNPQD